MPRYRILVMHGTAGEHQTKPTLYLTTTEWEGDTPDQQSACQLAAEAYRTEHGQETESLQFKVEELQDEG